jgi:nucleotide-binding universal stress UspA family protein
MIELKRILVPTDFSKFSQQALMYGVALAEKFGAEICLLHVVQDLAVFIPDMVTVAPPIVPSLEQMTAAVQAAFDRIVRENNLERFSFRREVCQGTPFLEIIRFAKENDIDLIVMGTHGHSGLIHVLMGSVTEKVVRKAPCPVLTVRHPEHEFVHP